LAEGGSEGIRGGDAEGRLDAPVVMDSGERMLAGGSDGGALERLRDEGTDGGTGIDRSSGRGSTEPPVNASTLRTSEGTSTGRTNRPLPSCARACSGLAM